MGRHTADLQLGAQRTTGPETADGSWWLGVRLRIRVALARKRLRWATDARTADLLRQLAERLEAVEIKQDADRLVAEGIFLTLRAICVKEGLPLPDTGRPNLIAYQGGKTGTG